MTPVLSAACAEAVHVVCADGTLLRAGRATLFITRELGWRHSSQLLSLPPFIWGVELVYRTVSTNRGFFSRFLFRKRGRTRGQNRGDSVPKKSARE